MAKPVSINDIAKAAGVSITTVSHALNGKGRIPLATRQRVVGVAHELGYRPNPQARGLATGKTLTIAIQLASAGGDGVIPDFAYFVELLNAAAALALERGYGLIVVPAEDPDHHLDDLLLDGAIVVDPTGSEPMLTRGDIPVVTTGRVPTGGAYASVDNDHRAGTRLVLDHFREVGCHTPALLTTAAGQSYVDDTVAEYTAWCAANEVEPVVVRISGAPTEAAAEPAAAELLSRPDRPDAVYATLDRAAVGVLQAARSSGLRVPDDVALAATTDSPILRAVDPPITALNLDAPAIGREAVRLLLDAVESGSLAPVAVTVPSSLVPRAATLGRLTP